VFKNAVNFTTAAPSAPPLQITSTSLPQTTVKAAYNTTLTASGGVPPYTWALASGQLPSGLNLSTSGVISGAAAVTGNFPFAVQLTDSTGASTSASLSLAVASVARFYSSTSFWNKPIAAGPTIDPNSANMISSSILPYVGNTQFNNYNDWGMAYVVGSPTDKLYTVTCTQYCGNGASFQVHIPAGTRASTGSDGHLVVVNGTTEYDMWVATYNSSNDTWSVGGWGSTDIYNGWGAECTWGNLWCTSNVAAGFAGMGGVIRPEEIQQGRIDHALSLVLPHPRSQFIVCPASGSDGGSTDPNAIPEGAHLQLDPTFNVDAQPWSSWQKTVAKAAQQYGMYVSDQNGGSTLTLYGQTDQNGGVQWQTLGLSNTTANSFSNFPWQSVRILKMQQNLGGGVCQ
jgi:hypothetical protein